MTGVNCVARFVTPTRVGSGLVYFGLTLGKVEGYDGEIYGQF